MTESDRDRHSTEFSLSATVLFFLICVLAIGAMTSFKGSLIGFAVFFPFQNDRRVYTRHVWAMGRTTMHDLHCPDHPGYRPVKVAVHQRTKTGARSSLSASRTCAAA